MTPLALLPRRRRRREAAALADLDLEDVFVSMREECEREQVEALVTDRKARGIDPGSHEPWLLVQPFETVRAYFDTRAEISRLAPPTPTALRPADLALAADVVGASPTALLSVCFAHLARPLRA